MTEVWQGGFTAPGRSEIRRLADETQQMIPYSSQSLQSPEARADLTEAWRRYVEIYFEMLAAQRLPTEDEIAEFEKIARRRLHQSVELVDLQRAFRGGTRILLSIALERVTPIDAGLVASTTLKFEDIMATAAERAYLDEQRSFAKTRTDIAVATLLRLVRGEITPDDPSLDIGPDQGFDFGRAYTVVEFASSRSAAMGSRLARTAQGRLGAGLRGILPFALQLSPHGENVILIVPGDSVSGLQRLLANFLGNTPGFTRLRVGVANPRAGLGALPAALSEAERARMLGEVLYPTRLVHLWDELERVDVFARGDAIDVFVDSTIGPLIEQDARKGTQLMNTLAAFFGTNGNRKAAAGRLNIHINTLDYRLRQIRTMLGEESLSNDSFIVQLALRLYPLSQQASGD